MVLPSSQRMHVALLNAEVTKKQLLLGPCTLGLRVGPPGIPDSRIHARLQLESSSNPKQRVLQAEAASVKTIYNGTCHSSAAASLGPVECSLQPRVTPRPAQLHLSPLHTEQVVLCKLICNYGAVRPRNHDLTARVRLT
jgi:hypothetical protein